MFGYHPAPSKSWNICSTAAEVEGRAVFAEAGLEVEWCPVHCYVGSFVDSATLRDRWSDPQVSKWVNGVNALAKVAMRFPQTGYAGFTHCLWVEL